MTHNNEKHLVNNQEWCWAVIWAVLILIITSLPYLYGAALSSSTNHFGGFIIGSEDGNSYLVKMQEGRAGYWLFYLAYTPEPHQGALVFSYYLMLGKLSWLLGIAPLLLLHLSRIVTIPFALLSFYRFVACFTSDVFVRRISFLLFGLTAGLGWLWVILGLPTEVGAMPVDMWVPDASFFLSAFAFPHLPMAQGLLLWVLIAGLIFLKNGDYKWGLVATGAGLLVSLIHPYTLPILSLLLGLYILWQVYKQVWSLWKSIGRLIIIVLPSLPYLVYVLIVFETNFAFMAWREQSLTPSPQPIFYILGFGILLIFVGVGLWKYRHISVTHAPFLIIWIVTVPLLIYIPIPLQRRFLDGYQIPLTIFGAIGLVWFLNLFKAKTQRLAVAAIILTLMTLTNLLLLMGGVVVVNGQASPIFHAEAQQTAFQWFFEHAQNQVVLTAYQTGNVLPAYAPVRVFVGHGPETINSDEKQRLVAQFFTESTSDTWRQNLLTEYNIDYLYYGPHERALGNFTPDEATYLKQMYNNGTIQIYQILSSYD